MKLLTLLSLAIVAVVLSERVEFVVRTQQANDIYKLNSFGDIYGMEFQSVLPKTNKKRQPSKILDELSRYFYTHVESKSVFTAKAQEFLLQQKWIEAAYFAPKNELPVEKETLEARKAPLTKSDTPLYQSRQVYLNKAPNGTDMYDMFEKKGGRGQKVKVVDVEGGWDFEHEDLIDRKGRLIHGSQAPQAAWKNHGSAVLGEIAGEFNKFGVTGLASKAKIFGASIYNSRGQQESAAKAIIAAADFLDAGDIILIELHRIGPGRKYIAMEWWPDVFASIVYATKKGVIVIEAGGNGAENLNNPLYDRPASGFPRDWKNPFDRTKADCDSIIIGAGAPPPGTNNVTIHGPDRCKLDFSNYGSNIDAQGYGREVVTLAYGDLQNSPNRNKLYTAKFSGTSSASPIVVGVVASLQGYAKKRDIKITPQKWRELLRSTGSPQTDSPRFPKSMRIGSRPNARELRKIIKDMEMKKY
eukprot:gene12788-7060_t